MLSINKSIFPHMINIHHLFNIIIMGIIELTVSILIGIIPESISTVYSDTFIILITDVMVSCRLGSGTDTEESTGNTNC